MNLAVLSRTLPLVPMERLVFPDFAETGGYPRFVRAPLPSEPKVIRANDDTEPPLIHGVNLQRFKFVIPRTRTEEILWEPTQVVITLYATNREEALRAVVDGRLRAAAPWVPARLISSEIPVPATPVPPAG